MSGLRGRAPAEVLARVSAAERRCGREVAAERRFRKLGAWLVADDCLTDIATHPGAWRIGRRVPGLGVRRTVPDVCALLWRRFMGRSVTGPSAAHAIRVKSSARAFYLHGSPRTSKVLLDGSPRGAADLANEVATRRRLAAWGTIRVPEILDHDAGGEAAHLCEALVFGRRCVAADEPVIRDQLLPQLVATWRRHGVVSRPVGEALETPDLPARLAAGVERARWRPEWGSPGEFLRRVTRILDRGGLLPCSLGHGDLSLSNLILTPAGEVYVVDWELARERPIAFDVAALLQPLPAVRAEFPRLLEALVAPGELRSMVPVEDQALLARLDAIGRMMVSAPGGAEGDRRVEAWKRRLAGAFAEAVPLAARSSAAGG